jgi:hypothetical protein
VEVALSEVHHALKAILEEGGALDSVTDPDTQRVVNAVRGTRFYELHREAETKHLEQERERIEGAARVFRVNARRSCRPPEALKRSHSIRGGGGC